MKWTVDQPSRKASRRQDVGIIFMPRGNKQLTLLRLEKHRTVMSVFHHSYDLLPVVINIFNTVINMLQGKFDTNSYQPCIVNRWIF